MNHNEITRWFEGDACPFCHDEDNTDNYYIETQGGGHEEYVRYCYQCPKCEKEMELEVNGMF